MVDGKIIEIYRQLRRPATRLWCVDPVTMDEWAVYALIGDAHVQVGDYIWWHGDKIYWIPLGHPDVSEIFIKLGGSFDPRPPAMKSVLFKGIRHS